MEIIISGFCLFFSANLEVNLLLIPSIKSEKWHKLLRLSAATFKLLLKTLRELASLIFTIQPPKELSFEAQQ